MKATKPYKGFSVLDVTQGFHAGHNGYDSVPKKRKPFGTPLVAPERVLIEKIWAGEKLTTSTEGIKNGYGITMIGQETGWRYVYWHCQPIFPVWGGDIIERGKIVAYMGNAGYVTVWGRPVTVEERDHLDPNGHFKLEETGTHLHGMLYINGVLVNPLEYIDQITEPTYTRWDELTAMMKVLVKISKLL